mgnify:CR=1 FL=1
MKVSNQFLIAQDESCHEITVMECTKAELDAHQKQLEELGVVSIIYDSADKEFDKLFVTSLGGFWVKFEDKK